MLSIKTNIAEAIEDKEWIASISLSRSPGKFSHTGKLIHFFSVTCLLPPVYRKNDVLILESSCDMPVASSSDYSKETIALAH